MRIKFGNSLARLEGCREEHDWVRNFLTAPDRTWALLDPARQTFPSGILPRLLKAADAAGLTVELQDLREPAAPRDPTADLAWLDDYQRDAVNAALQRERGIIWSPCGSGKGEMVVALAMSVRTTWLILVHRSQLAIDLHERLVGRGVPAGLITSRKTIELPESRAIVATYGKLARLDDPEFFKQFGGIVCDECHICASRMHHRVTQRCVAARYRIGLSGTPLDRGDQRSIVALATLGPLAYRIQNSTLLEQGAVTPCEVRFVRVTQQAPKFTNWHEYYDVTVVRSARRNEAVCRAVELAQKPTLVFVSRLDHGQILSGMLEVRGIAHVLVEGKTSSRARDNAAAALQTGQLDVAICTSVWQEGINITTLRSVVNAAGGQSTIAAIQRAGRGARLHQDKQKFQLWDFADMGSRILMRQYMARRTAYERESYTIMEIG